MGSFCQCEILLIGAHMRWDGGRNESILVGVLKSSDSVLLRKGLTHNTGIRFILELYTANAFYEAVHLSSFSVHLCKHP